MRRASVGILLCTSAAACSFPLYLKDLFRQQVVDARGAARLGARVVRGQAASGREPDGIFLVDRLGRITVADQLEDPAAVDELLLVQARRARMSVERDRPLVAVIARADLQPRWTDAIHEEWIRSVLENRPDLSRERLERTRKLMEEAVLDSSVRGFE